MEDDKGSRCWEDLMKRPGQQWYQLMTRGADGCYRWWQGQLMLDATEERAGPTVAGADRHGASTVCVGSWWQTDDGRNWGQGLLMVGAASYKALWLPEHIAKAAGVSSYLRKLLWRGAAAERCYWRWDHSCGGGEGGGSETAGNSVQYVCTYKDTAYGLLHADGRSAPVMFTVDIRPPVACSRWAS